MKKPVQKNKSKQAGSALLTTLVICTILGVTVVSYLSLISQQSKLSARSQSWNLSIGLVEAGIEEGLQQLNQNSSQLSSNGWTYNGSSYGITRTFPNGNSYTVYITNGTSPTIFARANVSASVFTYGTSPVMFAVAGNAFGNQNISRAVVVTCSKGSMFTKAMVAKNTIDLHGNNINTDSFDSTSPTYSTGGQYDPTKTRDGGDVASNATIVDSVSIGNANIHGHVATGPGGTISIGSQGSIGSTAWQAAGNHGAQPGWTSSDSNFTFPDTSLPYSSGIAPSSGDVVTSSLNPTNANTYPSPAPAGNVVTNTAWITSKTYPAAGSYIGGISTNIVTTGPSSGRGTWYTFNQTTYNYAAVVYTTNQYDNIINAGDYYATSLSGSTLVVGTARLVLPNGLNLSGGDTFTIAPTGSITVYAGGTSCSIGGNGVINQPGYAANFILYCAPTVTSFSLNGNGGFTGVLVAPNVNIAMNGGGSTTTDFIGCLIVNSVTMNGHFNFHYDEALGSLGGNGRYLVTSWNEVAP